MTPKPCMIAFATLLAAWGESSAAGVKLKTFPLWWRRLHVGSRLPREHEERGCIIRPAETGRKLARKVAREQAFPENRVNGDAVQFLAEHETRRPYPKSDLGHGPVVAVPTAACLLALKLRARRPPLPGYPGHDADIVFLLGKFTSARARKSKRASRAFKRRNRLSSDPNLPVRLRTGRPRVSADQRRANNAEHQRRLA